MENEIARQRIKKSLVVSIKLLAKSLVIFICVGLISGLGFGVYLLDIKNTNQLIFVEGPSISLVTEKIDFKKGEEIRIRIVNSGSTLVIFPDTSYGLRITGLSGILMYSPVGTQTITKLEPGEEIGVSWDQMKNDDNAALEGLYKISANAADQDGNKMERSTTVTIWK